MIVTGERQVAKDIRGIRRDHVARYEWAAKQLLSHRVGSPILDLACGVGYGTQLLGKSGFEVYGVDQSSESIDYARHHYAHSNVAYLRMSAENILDHSNDSAFGAVVCFEMIEHIENPLPILKALHQRTKRLLCSVPNQEVFPYIGQAFHFRHYTPGEFHQLLDEAGWGVKTWWGQTGPESPVEINNMLGRTVIADCEPKELRIVEVNEPILGPVPELPPVELLTVAPPEHVVILGLGPSLHSYMDYVRRLGCRKKAGDEVWAINALGDLFQCDRIFHMDDVRIQEIRARARPESNIANMLTWLKHHPGPIYTSQPHPDYPGLVAFPLEDVVDDLKVGYFNNTAAYALAYAIHIGVKKVSIYGCDYTYPNAHDAEKGRGCLEFWAGFARARGIEIRLPKETSLMDALEPDHRRYYGYDAVEIKRERDATGRMKFSYLPRPVLPTADEIEAEYDHTVHPNAQVRG